MQTLIWCEKRTDLDWPANCSVHYSAIQGRQWKFAQIRSYLLPGTMFPSRQGAYEKEATGNYKESLIMQTLFWYENRTFLDGPANCFVFFSVV